MTTEGFWREIFGRAAPVEVEIGPGRGAFLFALSSSVPDRDFLAIERSASRAARLVDETGRRRLTNVRIVHGDAGCVVQSVIPDSSVCAYHIGFPDPWWKRRHHRRRLFQPGFVAALARTLRPGGLVHVATDVDTYFTSIVKLLSAALIPDLTTPPCRAVSQFEQKAREKGGRIYSANFRKPE